MKHLLYLLILISGQAYGQQVKGYLYDPEGRVADFSLWNTTQDLYATSDSNGYFEILANIDDTIVLQSISYKAHSFRVTRNQIQENIIIVLEPSDLEEVVVNSYQFDAEKMSESLQESLQNDILQNPRLYEPSRGNIGYLIHGFISLFKKDKKSEEPVIEVKNLSTKDLISLFKSDGLLNEKFLTEELKIPPQYHNLFLDYLSSKGIRNTYLDPAKKLDFMELIYKYNKVYHQAVNLTDNEGL